MAKYKVFLHGVPIGHEMCGATTEAERDYLKQFYGTKSAASTMMQTDIVNGVSYYSYIRKNDFSNAEGRPGSYFGITVSLGRNICKDVASLYNILDATYKKFCVGSIVRENANGGMFLVREINSAKYRGHAILDCAQEIVEKNIDGLIGGNLAPIDGNVNTHGSSRFHISEVNSPLFINAMLSKTVLVSPAFEPTSSAYHKLASKYSSLETEYVKYKDKADRLEESLRQLERSNADLQKEMTEAASRADVRYKKELDAVKNELADLKQRLTQCESERDNLEKRLLQATSAIEKIDEPYRQLSHLMTGRAQSTGKEGSVQVSMYRNKKQSDSNQKVGLSLVNLVLLLLVLIIAIILLLAVKNSNKTVAALESTVTSQMEDYKAMVQNGSLIAVNVNDVGEAVDWAAYTIDMQDYTGKFQKGKSYPLSLKKKDGSPVDDNAKGGTWEVSNGIPGILITDKNNLYIGNAAVEGTNIQVFYTVDGIHEVTITIPIQFK